MRTLVKILLVLFLVLTYGCDVASQSGNDQNNDVNTDQGNNGSQASGDISIKDIYTNINGLNVLFSALLENVNSDDVEYLWDFGGSTSSDADTFHTYSQDGTYDITLTVTRKSDGKTATHRTSVSVTDPTPKGAFVDFSCVENDDGTVTCTAQVTGAEVKSYLWVTNDDYGKTSETVDLSLHNGKQNITVHADLSGDWSSRLTCSKEVIVGKQYTDRVLLYEKQKTDTKHMYFALKVKGTSPTGKFFRQNLATSGGSPDYAYARDLHFQVQNAVVNLNGKLTPYSNFKGSDVEVLRNKYDIYVKGYNIITGFANEEGSSFEFPFYYGDDNFRVLMNGNNDLTFTFKVFTVWDTTKQGEFMGNPDFISMRSSNPLEIKIPMDTFDNNRHKNIALLTVDFTNYESPSNPKPIVRFDKFVEK